ncbi:hypothetical protein JTE90_027939 [Oedothorax gibbosus]|uniref:C2H2-type domain-containing protein n=1 Tax=Oedothorax gibbosus TaxID=931172 RepID=A0AAV6VEG8_9ARAC|nr:hypothetical protein JTE90_027939 [Oedothorax gibbosus]
MFKSIILGIKKLFRFNSTDVIEEDSKRPYKCHLCPYAAHTRSNLKNHINAHTGERPYKCPVCGRGFTQKGNMKKHEQQHGEDRFPLDCHICGDAFENKLEFQQHMLAHFLEDD